MSEPRSARLHREYPHVNDDLSDDNEISEHTLVDADVDIIAVQGLASTYERTWSVETDSQTKQRYHWLRERLPIDLKNNDIHANVYAFEYPSVWYDRDPDHTSLEECGRQLLASVQKSRRHKGAARLCPTKRDRPIIFIGHSFGGLVVKQALLLSSQNQPSPLMPGNVSGHAMDARDIMSAVAGIFFLGTPHRGSAISTFAQMKMNIGGFLTGMRSSPELITVLELDSILLSYIQSSFSRLRKTPELAGTRVYCFFEKKALAFPPQRVVEERSACLDDAENIGLDANHMELNKYGSGPNENYDTLYHAIQEACKAANQIVPPRLESRVYNSSRSSADLQELRHWLAPSLQQNLQLNRKLAVHKANNFTCQWLLDQPFFRAWNTSEAESGVLWLTGILGSGKSVLAAFTISILRAWANQIITLDREHHGIDDSEACLACSRHKSQPAVLYFFGGVDRTHESIEHILGTLIDQLMTIHRNNEVVILIAQKFHREFASDISSSLLLKLLIRLIDATGPAFIVVDGVDELPLPGQTLGTLSQLHEQAPTGKVNLMLCSQTTRMLRDANSELLESTISHAITDYTSSDIQQFIQRRTRELVSNKPEFSHQEDQITSSLEQKANGMFQWVKTTTDQLALDATPESLDEYLNDLTSEMADGWERVFERLGCSSLRHRKDARKALMWLHAATRPLSATELRIAMNPPVDYPELRNMASNSQQALLERDAAYAKEFYTMLVPLIEINKASNSLHYIQLAHSSLRAALTAPGSLGTNTVQSWIGFSAKEAHYVAAMTCMNICAKSTFAMANAFGSQPIFMVEYAWQHWAYHLKLSEEELTNPIVADAFEKMVVSVSRDSSALLCAFAEFVDQPLKPTTWKDEELAQVVCFQRAQKSLTKAIEAMTALRSALPAAQGLQLTRTTLEQLATLNLPEVGKKFATKLYNCFSYAQDMVKETKTSVHNFKGNDYAQSCSAGRLALNPMSKILWDLTKELRSVTLRVAVNPIHTILMLNSRSEQFSPINALVNIAALFEEVGNYPYWTHLPKQTDVLEPFVTTVQDPQHGPARFVLYSMVNRNFFHEEAGSGLRQEDPPVRFHSPQPDRRLAADDFAISASHKELVKKVHKIPFRTYYVSMARLGMLRSSDHFVQTYVLNPIGNQYIQNHLILPVADMTDDPRLTLSRHAPEMATETHRAELIRAIPQLALSNVVYYIMFLFEQFGGVSRQAFAIQFSRLQEAKVAVEQFKVTLMSCFNTDSVLDLQHVLGAIFLYALRLAIWPSLGANIRMVHWQELMYCFSHPAQYLEAIQQFRLGFSFFGLSFWLRMIQVAVHDYVGKMAIPAGVEKSLGPDQNKALAFVFLSFGIYHKMVAMEEAVYNSLFTIATSVATGLLMFHDADRIEELVLSSMSFWFYTGVGFFIGITSALAGGINFWYYLASLCLQLGALIFFARLGSRLKLGDKVWWLIKPFATRLSHALRLVMQHYGRAVQLSSMIMFLFLIWRSFWMVDAWIWDPYNTKGSRSTLGMAHARLKATLESHQVKSIGSAPFGGELQRRQESIDQQRRKIEIEQRTEKTGSRIESSAPLYTEPGEAELNGQRSARLSSTQRKAPPRDRFPGSGEQDVGNKMAADDMNRSTATLANASAAEQSRAPESNEGRLRATEEAAQKMHERAAMLVRQTDAARQQRERERIARLGTPPRSQAYQDASLYAGKRPAEVSRRDDADTHAKVE